MSIPVAYNLRNLIVRKTTTIMTALGIALTVAVLLASFALISGLRATLNSSADPLRVMVMRKGATGELTSSLTRQNYQNRKSKSGIPPAKDGQPMSSLEVLRWIILASVDNPSGVNLTVRG